MTDTRGTGRPPGSRDSQMWTWIAVAAAVVIFVAVVFMWTGEDSQQQAEIPAAPPAATEQRETPPQKNPAPANTQPPAETAPPANQPSNQ